jgi:UDP-N-acetylmuramoylalanine--D-glutamate ligase
MTDVRGKRVTVLGLGHFGGGIAVTRWLAGEGAAVTVVDDAPADRLADSVAQLGDVPVTFRLGGEATDGDFTSAELVVASPAVPPNHRSLLAARGAGVAVTTEIVLFVERCPAPVIGVTGTKGKSTTSTLLGRMLSTRFTTWVGGNIGRSLLAELPNIRPDDRVVLELSSFMLHYLGEAAWSPRVAVVTMVSRDHLDWHGSVDAYVGAKRHIVAHQTRGDVAVLNRRDPVDWSTATPGMVVHFNTGQERPFALRLPGDHNQLNAQAAFAAASVAGVTWDAAQAAIADFGGLPHRLEVVADVDGVRWVNDSIATIPEAAVAALRSFPAGRVIQIVGGSGKKALDASPLCDALAADAKGVLCIGETGKALAAEVNRRRPGRAESVGDLTTAVRTARSMAATGDVVLMSPGHPSYDQFVNFQRRGEMFTALARGTW